MIQKIRSDFKKLLQNSTPNFTLLNVIVKKSDKKPQIVYAKTTRLKSLAPTTLEQLNSAKGK